MSRVEDCRFIELPKIADRPGNLTFVEGSAHVPFDLARVFYVYDIPADAYRGTHAHKTLHEVLVCISGSFDVNVDDGTNKATLTLNRPWRGLHLPPMLWASQSNFAPGTVYLVLASAPYDVGDYIRDYDEFLRAAGVSGG